MFYRIVSSEWLEYRQLNGLDEVINVKMYRKTMVYINPVLLGFILLIVFMYIEWLYCLCCINIRKWIK